MKTMAGLMEHLARMDAKRLAKIQQMQEWLKPRTCGAKTKTGATCQSNDLLRGGRCKAHGGLSTGPKTIAGKERSAMNIPGMTYEIFLKQREQRIKDQQEWQKLRRASKTNQI